MNQPVKQQSQALSPVSKMNHLMQQYKGQIEAALPKHVTPERLMRICLTEYRRNPRLQQCDPVSFLGAVVTAASLGLEPGSALGQCYLVPYKNECEFQIGYRGMVDIARRSGNIISLQARAVYKGDHFKVILGTEDQIEHEPKYESSELTHVYAVAKLVGGGVQFDVMSVAEIDSIRARYSKAAQGKAWTDSYDEMAKKTVVRRLFKMLPASVELAQALDAEEDKTTAILDADYVVPEFKPDTSKLTSAYDEEREEFLANELAEYRAEFISRLDKGKKAPEVCGQNPKEWAKSATREQLATALSLLA